jgi:hypothetical protein
MVKPMIFSWNNDRNPEQVDRAQELTGDLTLNKEKQYEIGRDGILGYKKNVPTFSYSMRQFEFGSMDFWYDLANVENPVSGDSRYIDLDDIKTTYSDIAAFLTDDNNTFKGTIWFPKLRVNGFSINIGDPDAIVERSFDLVGEDYRILDGKYFAFQKKTASGATETVVLSPVPVEYAAAKYIFRVLRVRGGAVSEIAEGSGTNTYTFTGPASVEVRGCVALDIIKIYYESSTAYTTLGTNNDSDVDFLTADSCEIFMKVGISTRIYKLQSVGIDVSFERTDYKEIGNSEVVQTGVKSKTVTVNLNRFVEDNSLEDILAGDTTYPYINPRDFVENIQLMVKVYSDKTHTTFKMGYLMNNLTPTTLNTTQAVEDYNQRTNSIESDNLKISDLESEIIFA